MFVGLVHEGKTAASLSDSNNVRGRIKLEVILNNRRGSGVK